MYFQTMRLKSYDYGYDLKGHAGFYSVFNAESIDLLMKMLKDLDAYSLYSILSAIGMILFSLAGIIGVLTGSIIAIVKNSLALANKKEATTKALLLSGCFYFGTIFLMIIFSGGLISAQVDSDSIITYKLAFYPIFMIVVSILVYIADCVLKMTLVEQFDKKVLMSHLFKIFSLICSFVLVVCLAGSICHISAVGNANFTTSMMVSLATELGTGQLTTWLVFLFNLLFVVFVIVNMAIVMKKKSGTTFLVFKIIECASSLIFMILPFLAYIPILETFSYQMDIDQVIKISVSVSSVLAFVFAILNLVFAILYKVFNKKIEVE